MHLAYFVKHASAYVGHIVMYLFISAMRAFGVARNETEEGIRRRRLTDASYLVSLALRSGLVFRSLLVTANKINIHTHLSPTC